MTTQPAAHPEAANPPTASTSKPKREHFSTDLSRKEMETRRYEAMKALTPSIVGNFTKTAIARMFGVSRNSVYRWEKKLLEKGTLQSTKTTGRPPRLTPEQEQKLKIACEHGITYDGLREQLAIFGIYFAKDHLRRVMRKLGIPLIKMPPGRPRG